MLALITQTLNDEYLDLLFNQKDSYKFIIGIIVFFVIPQLVNIVNTFVKNKSIKDFMNKINNNIKEQGDCIKVIKDRVDLIFNDNFEESTTDQIEAIFKGRVSIDIELLVKNTRQVIIINNIKDVEATNVKVIKFCNTICSNSELILNKFKRNGEPCGNFINSKDWVGNTSSVILYFIYNRKEGDAKNSYNYDALRYQLKGHFDTFVIDFVNTIDRIKTI